MMQTLQLKHSINRLRIQAKFVHSKKQRFRKTLSWRKRSLEMPERYKEIEDPLADQKFGRLTFDRGNL